ncbi:sensor histidine kinase [Caldibacillus lycopersici]|uniref:Sensor histidine kinase n=1 Tax=Perspicuibacillus lycopersici TaxID=1325689 RepID=A0AAE3IQ34_9BACI|nr:sensor histidine kinase [Perspicuibacillus lycopersici]MCU9612500.1 sensor histidine kinase [Perspicuibacillus lycopersici]
MGKISNLTIWFIKQFCMSALFSTVFFFITIQIYIMLYPNASFHLPDVIFLSASLFFLSLSTAIYFGLRSSTEIKKRLRTMITFLSSLRRGKYTERLPQTEKDEIGILADEINDLAAALEEQVITVQRLANDKSELHQHVRNAAVLEERQRLARDLHDSVSQHLFALSMMASANLKMIEANSHLVKPQMEQIASIAAKAQGEMRALLLHLRPVDLSGESLSDGVITLLKELKGKTNLLFDASVDEIEGLPKSVEEHLFRIIQEALSNILRHSNADSIKLTLTEQNQFVYLYLHDNGKGFDTGEQKKVSYGLKTMQERCEEIGGVFTLRSQKGKGTYIEIRIPIRKNN